jgi:glycosyltransferase involved in cell wall biosynthesis
MIDIVIMTKDDGYFLERTINSILETVSVQYRIYIVDNASSSPQQLVMLDRLEEIQSIQVIRNSFNLWVLGLNKLLSTLNKEGRSKYFLLSDADITFPKLDKNQGCWLTYLVSQMNQNTCIGKLGLSLDWSILENNSELDYILQQEKSLYSKEKVISELYISPVDTTAALYRWDWSIANDFKFYPLHMSYLRPELYSCRTPRTILAEHLGWELYCNEHKHSVDYNLDLINSKVLCFSIVAGDIKKTTLQQASLPYRSLYYFIKTPMKVCWVAKRIFHGFLYHINNCLRKYDNT